jgi:hypothetical protein
MTEQERVRFRADAEQFVTRFQPPPSSPGGNWYFSLDADLCEPTAETTILTILAAYAESRLAERSATRAKGESS